jgi:hypothetical protein
MKREFWIYCAFVVLGIIVVALPDNDNRLFSLSEKHGPSRLDIAGLVMVIVPWIMLTLSALRKWRIVLYTLGRRLVTVLIALSLVGLLVLVVSIRSESDHWITGAVISFVGQAPLIVAAFRKPKGRARKDPI